ncbi:MAG: hypothetical protein E4H10_15360 [Bacteroidia bacterium]|nr:MAG: hypothetical protein E4H10_15360 [Bacteroidia bacterium]
MNLSQYRQISGEEYTNKVAGGWLGQAIAMLWGQWTEGIWQGEMIPFSFPIKHPPLLLWNRPAG